MADEEEIAEAGPKSSEGKKGSPSILVIIIVALVSIAIGFVGSKALGGKKPEEAAETKQVDKTAEDKTAEDSKTEEPAEEKPAEDNSGDSGDTEEIDPVEDGKSPGVLIMQPYTVNLNDPFGRRYAQINLKLKMKTKNVTAKIRADELIMSEIRDEIFMVIASKSYNELKNTSGKITLKEEIRMRVNEIIKTKFKTEPVQKIFFEKFLIQ